MMSKLAVLKLASLLNDALLFYYQTNMRLFDKRGFLFQPEPSCRSAPPMTASRHTTAPM